MKKAVIGQCDFFIGSRMHACIAALSQGVPCVGVAYSMKFAGVFDTVGMERMGHRCSINNNWCGCDSCGGTLSPAR